MDNMTKTLGVVYAPSLYN